MSIHTAFFIPIILVDLLISMDKIHAGSKIYTMLSDILHVYIVIKEYLLCKYIEHYMPLV